jgi:8-oxo-dGTP pyrophosphatase MutT (NUDIX family)
MKESAGVIIVLNKKNEEKKILICHPSNAKWYNSYSFPKGGIDEGETIKQAAIRELFEETSVKINSDLLNEDPIILDYYSFKNKDEIFKRIYLYVYYINDISEIGLKDEVIPKENLQLEEVDWAGFLTITESKLRLFYKSTSILNKI